MNSLSWLIYLAQVVNNLGVMFGTMGVLVLAGCVIYFIVCSIDASDAVGRTVGVLPSTRYPVIGVSLLFLSNLLPSQNTLYAIAASEVGEKIVTSEAARGIADDATKALHQWIKRQIEHETKK